MAKWLIQLLKLNLHKANMLINLQCNNIIHFLNIIVIFITLEWLTLLALKSDLQPKYLHFELIWSA